MLHCKMCTWILLYRSTIGCYLFSCITVLVGIYDGSETNKQTNKKSPVVCIQKSKEQSFVVNSNYIVYIDEQKFIIQTLNLWD